MVVMEVAKMMMMLLCSLVPKQNKVINRVAKRQRQSSVYTF